MALQFRPGEKQNSSGVLFSALDGSEIVEFLVTAEALRALYGIGSKDSAKLLGPYHEHKEEIQKVAARKYAARLIETDGKVVVHEADLSWRRS